MQRQALPQAPAPLGGQDSAAAPGDRRLSGGIGQFDRLLRLRDGRSAGLPAARVSVMSYTIREPSLHATPVLELRPTQMTLGLREVALKRKAWKAQGLKKLDGFLAHHMAPVVIGPGGQRYLIDHHHLARALYDEGVGNVFVAIVADFHRLDAPTFWNVMDFHGWTHPFDAKGRRRDGADLPKTVKDMEDDPYRSLAGELRNSGGFAKDTTPFSEFIWADFLRPRIKAKDLRKDFDAALVQATVFAKSEAANYLPGWCAPHGKPALAAAKIAVAKAATAESSAGKNGPSKNAEGKAGKGKAGKGKTGKSKPDKSKTDKSKGGLKMRPDAQPAAGD
jgi:hypothetical protein